MRKLLALLALLVSSHCFATVSVVQSTYGSVGGGVSTLTASFGSLPVSGHTVYWISTYQDGGYATAGCATVADNQGNSLTKVYGSPSNLGGGNVDLWRVVVGSTSGTYTVTCTAATSGSLTGDGTIVEVANVSATIDQDTSVDINTDTASPYTLTAGSPNTNAGDIEFSAFVSTYGIASATGGLTGWTTVQNQLNGRAFTVAYRIPATTETTSATWTWTSGNAQFGAMVISMQPSGGGSCTHSGATSAGALATPNGTTGSYLGKTGGFVTPDCSSINYKQPTVGNFGTT